MRLTTAIKASRANGARSRGPKSPAGKRRSSLNAIRHGLLAKNVVLMNESEEVFAALLAQHMDKLGPADDVEQAAVEEMAASLWRLRRMWAIEKKLFDKGIEKRAGADEVERIAGAFSELVAGPELHLLDRYETRLHRMYQRSLHNFLLFRRLDLPDAGSAPDPGRKPLPQPRSRRNNRFPNEPVSR